MISTTTPRSTIFESKKMFVFLIIFRYFFRIYTSYNKSISHHTLNMSKKTEDKEKEKEKFIERAAKGEVLAFT